MIETGDDHTDLRHSINLLFLLFLRGAWIGGWPSTPGVQDEDGYQKEEGHQEEIEVSPVVVVGPQDQKEDENLGQDDISPGRRQGEDAVEKKTERKKEQQVEGIPGEIDQGLVCGPEIQGIE
jgi:hypothetical protein